MARFGCVAVHRPVSAANKAKADDFNYFSFDLMCDFLKEIFKIYLMLFEIMLFKFLCTYILLSFVAIVASR